MDAHHSAGGEASEGTASNACSDIWYTCQLGIRARLPEMSPGHVSKGFSICVSPGMGGIAAPQFPPHGINEAPSCVRV